MGRRKEPEKPCPFCGEMPLVECLHVGRTYRVRCLKRRCPVMPSTKNFRRRIDAVRAWDRRKDVPMSCETTPMSVCRQHEQCTTCPARPPWHYR